ncbi:MAG: exodeoxyribonuclease III, partial [Dehalococcoidia bacterium]
MTLKILSWNVNGLRAAAKKGFPEWLSSAQPDILGIQEMKASPEQLPAAVREVPGYHAYFNAGERKGYSGVALYSKREPLSVSTEFGVAEFDCEGRMLIADYGEFVLMNIYYPNGQSSAERLDYKMRFYDAFLDFAEGLRAQGRNLLIGGDINTAHTEIDLARPGPNSKVSGFLPQEREWVDKFIARGYVDTFRMFCDEPG